MKKQTSLLGLLQERASQQPDDAAYTFVDYEAHPDGFKESITWSQARRRALVVAAELIRCGSVGDRAAILAPQGLDYIAAFLGVLQAGLIAVPLPVPQSGVLDERVSSALRDCSPSIVLTTSAAVDDVTQHTTKASGYSSRSVIEVDALGLDSPRELNPIRSSHPSTAYLQYTAGSTRQPTGVIVSHLNVIANLNQAAQVYFEGCGNRPPPGLRFVSWVPFYHDMGLIFSIFTPMFAGNPVILMSPLSFLQRPARWMQLLGQSGPSYSCAPNFALDLAARRTSDDDMAGLDLSGVLGINNGGERVLPATVKRFNERFARFNLKDTAIRPSYGLAEATLCVAAPKMGRPPTTVRLDSKHLSRGYAKRWVNGADDGSELISYGVPAMCIVRIVNPETKMESPPGTIGEIWLHGDNVAAGYWQKPRETRHTFRASLLARSPGTPADFWLRTGDLGVMLDGELLIVGRIKDLIVIDGSNHYPDDIEATIQEAVRGRAVAISVPDGPTEQLVAIVELKMWRSHADHARELRTVKHRIRSSISKLHRLRVADLVLVPPGSIPITTSGKVRRSACVECYRNGEFQRLGVSADPCVAPWQRSKDSSSTVSC